jgi:membrane protein
MIDPANSLITSIKRHGHQVLTRLENVYQTLNQWTHGGIDDLRSAHRHYLNVHGNEGATAIAFFTIFALPPLLIIIVTIGSYFLETQKIQAILINVVKENLPIPTETVLVFIQNLLAQRTTLSIIGILGLFWSGSGVLTALTVNIDRAFPDTRRRTIFQSRLIAFLMIGVLGFLLILSSLMTTIFNLIYQIDLPYIIIDPSLRIIPGLFAFFFRFILLFGLYFWIPNTRVRRRAAFWGALAATTAVEITSRVFTWYLQRGLDYYNFLYGSLGTLVALMFWIYLNAQIIIICAHLTATINVLINSRTGAFSSR